MKRLFTSTVSVLVALTFAAPLQAVSAEQGARSFARSAPMDGAALGGAREIERKGRGRGGRSKPRIPGGSGCDDPGDVLEHPECSG